MDDQKITNTLNELIEEGHKLYSLLYSYRAVGHIGNNLLMCRRAKRWAGGASNLLKVRFGEKSDYHRDFLDSFNVDKEAEITEFCKENVMRATGVLEYVRDALSTGLTEDLFYKREIVVLGDVLEQAYEFHKNGLFVASGIYGRIVLETVIKEFAQKSKINTNQKFDAIIIELRKKELIHKPFENSLRSNYEIGSWAAHGDTKFNELTKNEIKEFLNFIRDKVLTLK